MPRHRLSRTARLRVPADLAYRVVSDYHTHHPHILPAVFRNLTVVDGGVGAGTTITFDLRVFGTTRHYRQVVTEPEPGRVLVERDATGTDATSFTIDPVDGDCEVTIATEFESRSGLAGVIERWFAGMFLQRLYADELRRLEAYAVTLL
jgi:hypothetical protein